MHTLNVIIPHFNSLEKLAKLIKSIPNKGFINITVIDDHSDFDFQPLNNGFIEKYPHINFISTPENQKGPGMARNEGVRQSKSDWVMFADADDYFLDKAFEKIESYLNSGFDCVFFAPTSINIDTNLPSYRHEPFVEHIQDFRKNNDASVFFKSYAPWCKLIKRELLLDHGIWFDDGIGGEDNFFSLKVPFYAKKVEADSTEIYCVTESNHSLTKSMSLTVLINHFNALSKYNDFLQSHNMKDKQAPMLGWILRGFRAKPLLGLKWLFTCLKKGYPLSIWKYVQKYTPISSRKTV